MSLFVFLGYLAVGVVLPLPLIGLGRQGRSFYLFSGALALGLGGLATASRALGPEAGPGAAWKLGGWPLALAVLFLAALAGLLLRVLGSHKPRVPSWLAATTGVAALMADAGRLYPSSSAVPGLERLYPMNALGSAWLAGSFLAAMILGHYYLVMPGASIAPLRRAFRFSLAALAVRLVLVGSVGVVWWPSHPQEPALALWLLTDGIFIAQRVLFGLLLPASLAYWTWKTIEMRSTQSATGILYVVVFLTLFGEALSVYLTLEERLPL